MPGALAGVFPGFTTVLVQDQEGLTASLLLAEMVTIHAWERQSQLVGVPDGVCGWIFEKSSLLNIKLRNLNWSSDDKPPGLGGRAAACHCTRGACCRARCMLRALRGNSPSGRRAECVGVLIEGEQ